jgi:hypothetical protein
MAAHTLLTDQPFCGNGEGGTRPETEKTATVEIHGAREVVRLISSVVHLSTPPIFDETAQATFTARRRKPGPLERLWHWRYF